MPRRVLLVVRKPGDLGLGYFTTSKAEYGSDAPGAPERSGEDGRGGTPRARILVVGRPPHSPPSPALAVCSQFPTGLWPDLQGTKLLLLCGRGGGTKGR